jgi:hypothetical protein
MKAALMAWMGVLGIAAAQVAPVPMPEVDDPDAVLAEINLPPEPWTGTNAPAVKPDLVKARALIRAVPDLGTNTPAIFVALTESADLAARAGDGGLAVTALEELGRYFIVPDLPQRIQEALQTAAKGAGGRSEAVQSLAAGHLKLADRWIAATNFVAAETAVRTANALSLRARDNALTAAVADAARRVTDGRQLLAARKTLAANPADPPANLLVGRQLCLREGNWTEGLRLLVRGSNGTIALAARADLDALDKGAADPIRAAADGWWQIAQQERDKADKAALQVRAAQLYQVVLPKVSEADRKRLGQRIALVTENGARPLPPMAAAGKAAAADLGGALPVIPPPADGVRRAVPAVSNRVEIVVLLRPVGGSAGSSTARDWLVRASTVLTNDAFLHVSLTEAAAAATQGGDTRACMAAFDHLEAHFEEPDAAARRFEALKSIERTAGARPEALPGIIDGYLRMALASLDRDRLEDAEAAMGGASTLLARSRDKALAEVAAWVARKVQIARQIADLAAALNRNASDATAHLGLGRLHGFERRDWAAGLPHLARSGHATLQGLAQRDLAAGRSGKAADLRAAADAWWNAAATEKDKEVRSAMQMRAESLYSRALADLADTERRKAETRIQAAKEADTRRLAPERQPELRRLMAWANNLPDVALTIAVSNQLTLPQSVAIRTLAPLADWTVESLAADATPIRSLEPLRGLPIHTLGVSSTYIADLAPVRTMRLKWLNVAGCPYMADLSPIENLGIETLHITACPVTNFAVLKSLPLKSLGMAASGAVTDEVLGLIADLPIEELYITATAVTSLAPIKDMRLRILYIGTTAVSDLTPLLGMPLVALNVTGCPNIHDYSPIARFPALKAIHTDPVLGPDLRSALGKIEIETINGQPAAAVLGADTKP